MTQNARGLFRATGKTSKAVADPVDGELVKTADPARNALDFYPTPSEPTLALLRAEHFRLCELGGKIWGTGRRRRGDGAHYQCVRVSGGDVGHCRSRAWRRNAVVLRLRHPAGGRDRADHKSAFTI